MLAEKERSESRDFYDHFTGEVYQLPLPQAKGMKIAGSTHGCLITACEDDTFHLLNPLIGTQISLPPTTAFQNVSMTIECNGDYIVAATHIGDDNWDLSFCRSSDEECSGLQLLGPSEVVFVGNAVYTVTIFSEIYSCNFTVAPKLIDIADLHRDACYCMDWYSYVVECAGDVLVVVRKYGFSNDVVYYTTNFRAFKLDVEGKKVVEVKNLGDYALFLGLNNSICLPTIDGGIGRFHSGAIPADSALESAHNK